MTFDCPQRRTERISKPDKLPSCGFVDDAPTTASQLVTPSSSANMSNRYGLAFRNGNGNGYADLGPITGEDYDPYGDNYVDDSHGAGSQAPSRPPALRGTTSPSRSVDTSAETQMNKVLEHIKREWPALSGDGCVPVQLALQLLDHSSVGRAHDYRKFQQTHALLQDSLKNIVHEHHQGFNSSIGTFHKIQDSIHTSQKRVRALKDSLASSKTSLCASDPELKKLSKTSQNYDELLQTLAELDDLRAVPDQLEARISEKRFLTAVELLQNALRRLRKPELDGVGALSDLRAYITNQESALMDILVEELHEHLYLKSPYCQERWQTLAKAQGAHNVNYGEACPIPPFHVAMASLELERAVTEDPMKNPEADTFYYISLLVEALNKLGRLQNAVEILKQRMPVELFGVVNETINEVDQRHPSSLRGGFTKSEGLHIYGTGKTQMRADVIYDLLWALYGKFEAISEGHRIFHEYIKALIRREGAGNNIALLGSFKELWNLYQNEIRSLLHNYVTSDADVYQFDSPTAGISIRGKKDAMRENLFKFSEADSKSVAMLTEYEELESIIQATVPGLTSASRKQGADSKKGRLAIDGGLSKRGTSTGFGTDAQSAGSYKSLVEPSVFNMSLLLPPTLIFLQRLKGIVPPGSDLATSTLTLFLDNFLVNVFQPQLDETLTKLCDTVFGEADAFVQDPAWSQTATRPVFKGTTSFFEVVTAFCRMLGTIPPDQALSTLIVNQMRRYYDRCMSWYKSLVTKMQELATDDAKLRASARIALHSGEAHDAMQSVWASDDRDDWRLSEKEVRLLMEQLKDSQLENDDIIQDRDTITSLCLIYTSLKWLAVKLLAYRHITKHDADSTRQILPRQASQRWALLNDPNQAASDQRPVQLPLTQETVQ